MRGIPCSARQNPTPLGSLRKFNEMYPHTSYFNTSSIHKKAIISRACYKIMQCNVDAVEKICDKYLRDSLSNCRLYMKDSSVEAYSWNRAPTLSGHSIRHSLSHQLVSAQPSLGVVWLKLYWCQPCLQNEIKSIDLRQNINLVCSIKDWEETLMCLSWTT